MVTILPYSIGGRPMPAKTPLGLFESSAACQALSLSNLNTCGLKWTPEAALQGTHPTHIGPSPCRYLQIGPIYRLPQTCSKQAAYRQH
jgi:hypothetical protein